jgi:hypothetical protein
MNADDPLVTRERAHVMLDRNVRTIHRALEQVPPDDEGPPPRWRLSTVRVALAARAARVGYDGNGRIGSRQICADLERLAQECERGLERLRSEPDIAKRRALLHGGAMRCVGDLDRALQNSLHLTPADERPMAEYFASHLVRDLVGEILGLTELAIEPAAP